MDLSHNDRSTYIIKTIQVSIEAFKQLLKISKAIRPFGRQSKKDKKSLHTLKHPTVIRTSVPVGTGQAMSLGLGDRPTTLIDIKGTQYTNIPIYQHTNIPHTNIPTYQYTSL